MNFHNLSHLFLYLGLFFLSTKQNRNIKIKDITRQIKKAVVAGNLRELQRKSSEKFGKPELPRIHLDSDGTEIDDEDYFQTLESNTELIAVFSGEQWIDVSCLILILMFCYCLIYCVHVYPQPTQYLTITTHNGEEINNNDVEKIHLKKLISLLSNNKCNMSILSEPDLELLSNLQPDSFADVIGKDFIEHLKEASSR